MSVRVGAIVLAAGGSVRMGRAKQLMVFEGKTLLRRAVEAAGGAGLSPIVVVIGARAGEMRGELAGMEVVVVENVEWEKGMGTSVRAGVRAIEGVELEGVVLMMCDQVLVGSSRLRELVGAHERTGKGLVGAGYRETVGVPAFFGRGYFGELLEVGDGEGARGLFLRHEGDVERVEMEEGEVDLDRMEDWERVRGKGGGERLR